MSCEVSTEDNRGNSPRSIIFEDVEHGLTILDIPTSIEEAQVPAGCSPTHRLLSSEPPDEPFETPEPKSESDYSVHRNGVSFAAQVSDLMTAETINRVLPRLRDLYKGPFHLPRTVSMAPEHTLDEMQQSFIPPKCRYVQGLLQNTRPGFCESAPRFDLIVMDPPWPNRSVRRKKRSYSTAFNMSEIRDLLSAIPISSHLSDGGLVAVWITNKPSVLELMTSPSGLFAQWGLELVTEWTWLKITASGEPLFAMDSAWRKPWEKLLIAKPIGSPKPPQLAPRVIAAVPDLHSRKPNLRGMFQSILGNEFQGLEVFARHLTSGWWCWGDQVLLFQHPKNWSSKYLTEPKTDSIEKTGTQKETQK